MKKNILPIIGCALLLLLAWGCGSGTSSPAANGSAASINKFENAKIREIYTLADQRATDSLLPYLSDTSAELRLAAATVFGSVQDAKAGPQLEVMLEEGDPRIVVAAAWAIGQLGDSSYCEHLTEALLRAQGADIQTIGAAIGKSGSREQLNQALMLYQQDALSSHAAEAIAEMLYRAGLRKIVLPNTEAIAIEFLHSPSIEARFYAAALLGRVSDLGPIKGSSELLEGISNNIAQPEVLQQLIRACGRCQDPSCGEKLRSIVDDQSLPSSVRANGFRASGGFHDLQTSAENALIQQNGLVSDAAAEYIERYSKLDPTQLFALAKRIPLWRARAAVLKTAMHQAVAQSSSDRQAILQYVDSLQAMAGPYEQAALYGVLGEDETRHEALIAEMLTRSKIKSIYAFEAYLSFWAKPGKEAATLISNLKSAIATDDPGLVAMAAEYIGAGEPAFCKQFKDVAFLDTCLQHLQLPEDIEAYNAVLKAKSTILQTPFSPHKIEFQHPIDWEIVGRIKSDQPAIIQTSKGEIRIRLRVEDAPGTVANFVKLMESGFYDGKTFHRVVPAFVAQGGCPRGDGWGSSPETIRSEWPPLSYVAGTFGMASAGKDTESCQWFMTHCRAPHLDGRYTIFAELIKGLEVLESLEIGDQIISIQLDHSAS